MMASTHCGRRRIVSTTARKRRDNEVPIRPVPPLLGSVGIGRQRQRQILGEHQQQRSLYHLVSRGQTVPRYCTCSALASRLHAVPTTVAATTTTWQSRTMATTVAHNTPSRDRHGSTVQVAAIAAPRRSTSTTIRPEENIGPHSQVPDVNTGIEHQEGASISTIVSTSTSSSTASQSRLPSFSSPADVWRAWTNRVLKGGPIAETSSHAASSINNSNSATTYKTLIQWWTRQRPLTTEAAETTWQLWNGWMMQSSLLLTESRNSDANHYAKTATLTQTLLHSVLDHWRLCIKSSSPHSRRGGVVVPYSTRHVWERLLSYQDDDDNAQSNPRLLQYTPRTYSIVLSALAYEAPTHAQGTNDTVYPSTSSSPSIALAHEILDHFLRRTEQPKLLDDTATPRVNGSLGSAGTNKKASASSTLDNNPPFNDDIGGDDSMNDDGVVVWNSVLNVVAKQGRGPHVGHEAEGILRRMQSTTNTKPNVITYASVLEALAGTAVVESVANASAGAAGSNAERLLGEMIDTLARSSSSSSNTASEPLSSVSPATIPTPISHTGRAVSMDTALSTCFLHVLRAWSKSSTPNGADRAHEVLQQMISRYVQAKQQRADDHGCPDHLASDYPVVKPTRHCFSAVMSGYADRGDLSKVQELLLQLQSLYHMSGCRDALLYPSTATFNSVLEAYGKQRTPNSALQAQQLLERLYKAAVSASSDMAVGGGERNLSSGSSFRPCYPDTSSVNTVVNAWVDSGSADAVDRAEALLATAADWPGVRLDNVSYTTLMKAWSLSNRPNAPQRCEDILHNMWKRYNEQSDVRGDAGVRLDSSIPVRRVEKPNVVSYATAIFAWSRAARRDPDAPLRAEAIYQDMLEKWQNGDTDFKPTLPIYVSLISAWARSPRNESDIRAQLYFDQIRGKYMAGDETMRPNDKVYNALISSKTKRSDGEGAERILKHMYEDYLTHSNTSAKPNHMVFYNVLSAWVNSPNPKAPERMEAILLNMQKEHDRRKWDCEPNRADFKVLLQCLAKLGTVEAAIRIESVLQHMCNVSSRALDATRTQPCSTCYALAIAAWAKCGHAFPEAPYRAQAIFDGMCLRNVQPDGQVYQNILMVWARSSHVDAGIRALSILNEIEARHYQDPRTNKAPDAVHFTTTMSAFANAGDAENVEHLFDRMIRRNEIKPSLSTVTMVLKAYSRCATSPHVVERADKFLRSMKERHGLEPDVGAYTTFMLCLLRSRRRDSYERSKAVVEEMMVICERDKATAPDATTFVSLLATLHESPTMSDVNKSKEAAYITAMMDHVGVAPTYGIQQILRKIESASIAAGTEK